MIYFHQYIIKIIWNKIASRTSQCGSNSHHGKKQKLIEKPKDFKGTARKLIKNYLINYRWTVLLVVLFAIASTIFTIIGPKILGNATTEIFNGVIEKMNGTGYIHFEIVGRILAILLILYLVSMLCSIIQGFLMANISQKITYQLRNDIAKKINRLPMGYFDKKNNGEVLSIITNDVDTLSTNLNQSITQTITAICTLLGILIMMISINGTMTLVSLAILPVTAILVKIIVSKSQKYFKKQQDYLGHVNSQVEEMYGGHIIVKAFHGEEKAVKNFAKVNEELYQAGWKSQFLSGLMHPLMHFISNIGYVAVAILGGYFAIKGKITVGNIQSMISYNKQFTQPINQIAQISGMIQSMMAASERIFEFIEEQEETEEREQVEIVNSIQGNIEFSHVKFGYQKEKTIIQDFTAEARSGQKIAIVGPTGAGKTTIVKLLMRFYEVNEGKILLDGIDIHHINRHELRRNFGMVLQDTWLFEGTIRDNIKYGMLDATEEQVIQAAKAANVHHFIETLPQGYDMMINEESSNISQGQKQLLTIARVILANPKILILDEATSSIDTRTEIQIQEAMDELMKGRTSFIIAHRLSTIKNADLILVMDHGDIVEQGNHLELLKKGGFYANLYASQFTPEED